MPKSFALALFLAAGLAAEPPPRLGPSGLAVPRFVSLNSGEVNARQGPSFAHPVLWRYQRAGLPVRVTAESGPWRRVEDHEGDRAWVHAAKLSHERTVVAAQRLAIRSRRSERARAKLWLEPGVVAVLEDCLGQWRKLRVEGKSGWAPAAAVWGAPACESDPPKAAKT